MRTKFLFLTSRENQVEVVTYSRYVERHKDEREVVEKRPGILGSLGVTRKVTKREEKVQEVQLSELITSAQGSAETACFMQMVVRIQREIPDRCNRIDGQNPTVTLLGSRDRINMVMEVLEENPSQYYPLICALLPQADYPRVNETFLDQLAPRDKLAIMPAVRVREHAERLRVRDPSVALSEEFCRGVRNAKVLEARN
ncbi:hypothetical protein HZC07_00350 [Candidatus Micrarchaeota archaeon]|nr:hypothetical protein [Candidatus Micrarchaeota archaeon]